MAPYEVPGQTNALVDLGDGRLCAVYTWREAGRPGIMAALSAAACNRSEPPEFSYYDDRIAPALEVGCAVQTTGCHVATDQKAAVGNLDLTSYDMLYKRRDTLPALGPYGVGQLLLKGGSPVEVPVQTFDAPDPGAPDQRFVAVTTDVRHAGGQSLREGSDGYAKIKSWIAQGYTRDGSVKEEQSKSQGECHHGAGSHPGFDPEAPAPDEESFRTFVLDIMPMLRNRCAGSACHGSPQADLYLSCGETTAERLWNYFAVVSHTDLSVSLSEILRRPLSKQRGGTYHEGGNVFMSTDEPDYVKLRGWVESLVERRLIKPPPCYNFSLGFPGAMPATRRNLMLLLDSLRARAPWFYVEHDATDFHPIALAISLGGHVRVGFEDSQHLDVRTIATRNHELVAKTARLAREIGRAVATPTEARRLLGLDPLS